MESLPLSTICADDSTRKTLDGRDELNLAEFPLCSLSDRNSEQNTLVFEDQTWDSSRGEMVPRQLTITASAEYGLPTAPDDEVLLGLIQLSKLQDFASRTVPLTRYQLINLLGWRNESKSYARIETALNRWVGVTLYYKNAWWNKVNQCWADEKFHILDNVTLFDGDQIRRKGYAQAVSSFTWNEVVFKSFQAGNLKSLDFEFYKSLNSAIAKRLYRFLDKRFWRGHRWEFDVKEVAWAHVGLARSYDITNLKRRLSTGIDELVSRGYLAPLQESERYQKLSTGVWKVVFARAKAKVPVVTSVEAPSERHAIERALVGRGVSEHAAQALISNYPLERIQAQLEVFDWMLSQRDTRLAKNPPGFLVSSIKGGYAPPTEFRSKHDLEERRIKAEERRRKAEERRKRAEEEAHLKEERREKVITAYWASLSASERARLEDEAMGEASPIQRQLLSRGGSGSAAARKGLLDSFALRMLQVE